MSSPIATRDRDVQQQYQQQQQSRQTSGPNAIASVSAASLLNTAVRRIFHIGPPSVRTYTDGSVCVRSFQRLATETCRHFVIPDSGQGFPSNYANVSLDENSVKLQDCQGTSLRTTVQQETTLVVFDALPGEEIELQHRFLIGNVHKCILLLGELYKIGWLPRVKGRNNFGRRLVTR